MDERIKEQIFREKARFGNVRNIVFYKMCKHCKFSVSTCNGHCDNCKCNIHDGCCACTSPVGEHEKRCYYFRRRRQ